MTTHRYVTTKVPEPILERARREILRRRAEGGRTPEGGMWTFGAFLEALMDAARIPEVAMTPPAKRRPRR